MKCQLLIWLVVGLTPHGFATSVLLIETPDHVLYLAADSLQVAVPSGRHNHICKIQRLGEVYWAAASNFYATSDGFSIEEIVASIGTEGTIESKMARFTGAVRSPLARQVTLLEKVDPEEYAHYLTGKYAPLEIAFVGIENGKPTWAITRYFVKQVKGVLTIHPEPVEPADGGLVSGVGFWGPAADYLETLTRELSANPVDVINKSLDKAAIEDPTKGVEGPYAILRLGKGGSRWLQGGECKGQ